MKLPIVIGVREVLRSKVHRTISQFIDRCIIRAATAAQPKAGTFPAQADEARELYAKPDLFDCPAGVPHDFKWCSETEFQFSSAIPSPYAQNNVVHGKLFRAGDNWQTRPAVVLIHGWNDEFGYTLRHPYLTKQFLKRGINVAMIQLPYHMRRRPRGNGAVNDFLSENLYCTIRAAQQAVSDIRMLLAWLNAQGCPSLGLAGVSLGGWLTGLVTCHDRLLDFVVMTIPVVRMDRVVNELEFCEPIRRSLGKNHMDFGRFNLRTHTPRVPRENILIIEAIDDLFACKDAIEELWQTWGQPEIWRLRHAHISILFSLALMRRTADWVAGKMQESSKHQDPSSREAPNSKHQ
jgi:hypothetical protein